MTNPFSKGGVTGEGRRTTHAAWVARRVALVYAAAGSAWIIGTDLAYAWWAGLGPSIISVEVAKGLAFILVTAGLLYVLLRRGAAALQRAEEARREEERRFGHVVGSLRDYAVYMLDTEGRVRSWNAGAERIKGYRAEEIIGRHFSCFFPPEDVIRDVPGELMRRAAEAGHADAEGWRVRKDGSRFWAEGTVTAIRDEPGALAGFVKVTRDLTERRRAAEQLRLLAAAVQSTREAVVITDSDLSPRGPRIEFVNDGFTAMSGYAAQEVVGRTPRLLQGPRTDRRVLERLKATLTAGQPFEGATVNYRKDGTPYHVEWNIAPVRDPGSGRVTHYISLQRDVTDRVRLEEELRQSQKMEAVGQLASGVAHDFNNLLTVIFGYIALAKRNLDAAHPAVTLLDKVDEAAQQASGVTKALLTFSSRAVTEKVRVDLGRLVSDGVALLRRMLPETIELGCTVAGGGPIWIRGDPSQLQQLVMNLAINARDAMPRGGRLRVTVDREGAAGAGEGVEAEHARLEVSDTGVGMTAEIQRRIFEPFFTTKPRGYGTGLGLAIVHGIVRDHEGRIEVETDVGRGSTFRVILPAAAAEAGTTRSAPREPGARGQGELILLAEDQAYVREIAATMLQAHGYDVVQASDGEGLLDQYRQHRARTRLLIVDVGLPKRSGLDCLREIRAGGDATPVILITGAVGEDIESKLDPATTLLRKPFQVQELVNAASGMFGEARRPA